MTRTRSLEGQNGTNIGDIWAYAIQIVSATSMYISTASDKPELT